MERGLTSKRIEWMPWTEEKRTLLNKMLQTPTEESSDKALNSLTGNALDDTLEAMLLEMHERLEKNNAVDATMWDLFLQITRKAHEEWSGTANYLMRRIEEDIELEREREWDIADYEAEYPSFEASGAEYRASLYEKIIPLLEPMTQSEERTSAIKNIVNGGYCLLEALERYVESSALSQ